MTATETSPAPHPSHRSHDVTEELGEAGRGLGLVAAAGELALAIFAGLLVCPPLMILAVAVVVPAFILVCLVALVGAICAAPVLLVRHVRRHHRTHHTSAVAHGMSSLRVRRA